MTGRCVFGPILVCHGCHGDCPRLGLFKNWKCAVEEVSLRPGEVLLIYTDGISEPRVPLRAAVLLVRDRLEPLGRRVDVDREVGAA